nr:hypothetical protein Iba_chr01aCG13460 [Ipomoea batatas]GMC54662.1 hypothetical protein Iba_chr01eCG0070 [Ipomoea batatas]
MQSYQISIIFKAQIISKQQSILFRYTNNDMQTKLQIRRLQNPSNNKQRMYTIPQAAGSVASPHATACFRSASAAEYREK